MQRYEISVVKNNVEAMVGGVYGPYVHNTLENRSWYEICSLLHGRLNFDNSVPGERGYGLDQEYDGKISTLSVDGGVSFRQENAWSVKPLLQFNYTMVDYNAFSDNLGARVFLQQGDSLQGRLGLEVRKNLHDTSEQRTTLWTRFSYLRDFSDANEVNLAGDTAVSEVEPNSYLLALGTDVQLSRSWTLQG